MEIRALQEVELRRSRRLQEAQENRNIEACILREADNRTMGEDAVDHRSNTATADKASVGSIDPPSDEDVSLGDALFN